MKEEFNTRILVIDDDENIRDSFHQILCPKKDSRSALSDAGEKLFGEQAMPQRGTTALFEFDLDKAVNGQDGLKKVREAVESGKPYSVIFVDMRMPGWDGLRTVQEIRKIDSRAEIIFVTAYSDHTINEIVARAGHNVGFHCKPFEVDEIRQLATKGVYDWNKAVNLENLICLVSDLRTNQWNTTTFLTNILQQISEMLGSRSAMLVQKQDGGYVKELATGRCASEELGEEFIKSIPEKIEIDNPIYGDHAYFELHEYIVVVLFDNQRQQLRRELNYLVRLFLEHARQAMVNAELQEELIRKEKISAVGQAVSMISHDLRNPIGTIIGCTDLLGLELKKEPNIEILGYIASSARDALKMTEDILDFVRGSDPELVVVESVEFMQEIESKTGFLKERYPNPELIFNTSGSFSYQCDKSKILRVVLNLVKNAMEALERSKTPDPVVNIFMGMEDDSGKVVFQVSDNGPGVPEKIRRDLFVPFKTFGNTKGTGLGLAIVKQFVESHGGDLDCQSQQGKTAFTCRIPADLR